MKRPLSQLVQTGPLCAARDQFEPYPAFSGEPWLAQLLERSAVRNVTAIWFQCFPPWKMAERRVADDMFFYITHGCGTAWIEGREAELRPGICAHFRRGIRHAAAHDPRHPLQVISLHYTAAVFASLTLPELLRFPDTFDLTADQPAAMMLQEACREYTLRPAGYQRGLEALTLRLLLRLIERHGAGRMRETHEVRLADLHRLLPALERIRGALDQPIFIPDLARRVGFSEAQFRRVFRRTMGVAPIQYLRRIRLEHACHLLRQTDLTVEAISAAVGYAEPAFFAHTFKRLIGLPPGQYRRTPGP